MNLSKAQIFVTGRAGFMGSASVSVGFSELFECPMINFDALTYTGNLNNVRELDSQDRLAENNQVAPGKFPLGSKARAAVPIANAARSNTGLK